MPLESGQRALLLARRPMRALPRSLKGRPRRQRQRVEATAAAVATGAKGKGNARARAAHVCLVCAASGAAAAVVSGRIACAGEASAQEAAAAAHRANF